MSYVDVLQKVVGTCPSASTVLSRIVAATEFQTLASETAISITHARCSSSDAFWLKMTLSIPFSVNSHKTLVTRKTKTKYRKKKKPRSNF